MISFLRSFFFFVSLVLFAFKQSLLTDCLQEESSVKDKVHEAIAGKLDGKNIVKEIYVKNKIYNVVVK